VRLTKQNNDFMKSSNTLKMIVSSVLIASSVVLIGGCSSPRGGGGEATYYSSYEGTDYNTSQTKAAPARPAETAATGSEVVIPLYQETVAVGKREVDAGTVHIKKVVKTETVNQPVELRRESISIDREPASSTAQSAPEQGKAFQEQEFTIQLHREEPVIEKQVVQSGRIVAQKQAQTEQAIVKREVRREDVAIDKGKAQDVKISQGAAGSPGGESQGSASGGAITDSKTLTQTTDLASVSGRMVQCSDVTVQQVTEPTLITIGGEAGHPAVYLLLRQPVDNLKAGDKISFTGTVKEPSKSSEITGALSNEASRTLNAQPFFVEAQSCQMSGR
jgi:stress response protein YsnF